MNDHDLSEEVEERFQVLENKVIHQEYTVDQLDSVVTQQHDQIDLLRSEVQRLRALIEEGPERTIEAREEPPPPHY
ncbi:MAG: SlyX family protein [bacterium]|nr:SlyX protein [Deltaproteobacteria bacterium]MCP4903841.1 SlyX family protein [bacterium]